MFCKKDIKSLYLTIKSGYVSTAGKNTFLFEKYLSKFTKSKYVVATCNGTSAYHLALKTLGVKSGYEFFVPACSYISIVNGLKYCQAEPHFVDIELENFGICPIKLEKHIKKKCIFKNGKLYNIKNNKRIFGITIFHNLGFPSKLKELIKISKKYNLKIIEDAAEALGSKYNNRHVGTFGDIGILSFNGNKIITTGGGGALLTNNRKYYNYANHISKTARKKHSFLLDYDDIGYNYRMPDLNAALGISQIKKINDILIKKKKITLKYKKIFDNDKNFKFIFNSYSNKPNYWLNSVMLKKPSKKKLFLILKFLNQRGIPCRSIWKNINEMSIYKKNSKADLFNTKILCSSMFLLPSGPNI